MPDSPAVVDEDGIAAFRADWGAGRGAPLLVEIGFARGVFLHAAAARRPRARFLGFEIKSKWCVRLLSVIERSGWDHVRFVRGDFRGYCADLFAPRSVTAFFVHFPDPWWKARHAKKRLVGPDFVEMARHLLVPGGFVSLRTDVPWYMEAASADFAASGDFTKEDEPAWSATLPSHRETVCDRVGTPWQRAAFYRTATDSIASTAS